MSKAIIATVDFGFTQVEGLMLPDGSYAMGASQVATMFKLALPQNASRDFKRILGKGSELFRHSTELSHNKATVLTLEQLKLVAFELSERGNILAKSFVKACVMEAIERRFDTAFGRKVTEDERNNWMKLRIRSKIVRRQFTDAVKDWGFAEGIKPDYARLTNIFYNTVKLRKGRDNYTDDELFDLAYFERLVVDYIDNGFSPEQALRKLTYHVR